MEKFVWGLQFDKKLLGLNKESLKDWGRKDVSRDLSFSGDGI